MYSGHTAGISLCVLMWTHYSKGEEWTPCCGSQHRTFITPNLDAVGDAATCSLTAVLAWVYAFTAFFFIIATHFHYVSDDAATSARAVFWLLFALPAVAHSSCFLFVCSFGSRTMFSSD